MKRLLAFALMVALMVVLLAIGTPAAVSEFPLLTPNCPFKVCMGDPIKPDGGWGTDVIDLEIRKYEGSLPFQKIYIKGTRQGGTCSVSAAGRLTNPIPSSLKLRLFNLLIRYYGPPREGFGPFLNNPTPPPLQSAVWIDLRNLYDVRHIYLLITSRSISISYYFTNNEECSNPLQLEKQMEGADAPARTP